MFCCLIISNIRYSSFLSTFFICQSCTNLFFSDESVYMFYGLFYLLLMLGKLFLKYFSFSLKSSRGNFINFYEFLLKHKTRNTRPNANSEWLLQYVSCLGLCIRCVLESWANVKILGIFTSLSAHFIYSYSCSIKMIWVLQQFRYS